MSALAAVNRRNPDPPLTGSDLIALLDTQMREGGSIEIGNFCVYFDEDYEEVFSEVRARGGREYEVEVAQSCPSFIVQRWVNGKSVKTAHGSLVHALRELEIK